MTSLSHSSHSRPASKPALMFSILFTTFALGLATSSFAQVAAPRALVKKPIHDFGEVPRGEKVHHTFEIGNTGDAPLEIVDVRSTCACAVVDYDRVIAPGETGGVRVDLDTFTIEGGEARGITLFTNDPTQPRILLTIQVLSRPYIVAQPGFVRYNVVRGFEADSSITNLLFSPEGEVAIERIESPNPHVTVEYREATEEERHEYGVGKQYVVTARLDPWAPIGALIGYLRVYVEHEFQNVLPIALSGFVRPVFAVTPQTADFRDVVLDKPTRTGVLLKRFSVEEVELVSFESDIDGLEIEAVENPDGRSHNVYFTLPVGTPAGRLSGNVTIKTGSNRMPEINIPVTGTIRAPEAD